MLAHKMSCGPAGPARILQQIGTAKSSSVVRSSCGGASVMKRAVDAVFFDLDDTLVLTHAADSRAHLAVKRLLVARSPPSLLDPQAVVDHFLLHFVSQPWDPLHQVDVTEWRSQLWNKGLECQDIHDMDLARDLQKCFDAERLLAFKWAEGVEVLVRNLQGQGVQVGIITNGHPQIQRAKLKACNAEDLFSIILVGGEEPNEKPHKDIFFKACKLAGCEPARALMVGDNLKTDIQGGLNAGLLATIWVNVHGSGKIAGALIPHHTVRDISELKDVLKYYGLLV